MSDRDDGLKFVKVIGPGNADKANDLPPIPAGKRTVRRCPFCGGFVRKDGSCPKVFWDDWNGGWEHA